MLEDKVGKRVVAIRDTADGVANIYGFGIYVGDEQPPDIDLRFPNPKIELDAGGVVWGYQCWWAPCENEEESPVSRLRDRVNLVPLPKARP